MNSHSANRSHIVRSAMRQSPGDVYTARWARSCLPSELAALAKLLRSGDVTREAFAPLAARLRRRRVAPAFARQIRELVAEFGQ